jgi:hypothetical protein
MTHRVRWPFCETRGCRWSDAYRHMGARVFCSEIRDIGAASPVILGDGSGARGGTDGRCPSSRAATSSKMSQSSEPTPPPRRWPLQSASRPRSLRSTRRNQTGWMKRNTALWLLVSVESMRCEPRRSPPFADVGAARPGRPLHPLAESRDRSFHIEFSEVVWFWRATSVARAARPWTPSLA